MTYSKLKIIAFDMDGTLFNSFSVSYDAIKEGFGDFWKEINESGRTPSWEKVKRLIGLPSYEFFPAILPKPYRDRWEILHTHVGDAERRRLESGLGRTFDGVHETLEELKLRGFLLGCLSNASKRYFDSVLDGCDLRKYFDRFSHLGEDLFRGKTEVLLEWSIEHGGSDSIIYVGDRRADIQAAHAAGVKAAGVTWGYGAPDELTEADIIIDAIPKLLTALDIT